MTERVLDIGLANKVLEQVEGNRKSFNMHTWFDVRGDVHYPSTPKGMEKFAEAIMVEGQCNTTACLAGWVATMDNDVVQYDSSREEVTLRDGTQVRIVDYAEQRLGLPQGEGPDLFYLVDDWCPECECSADYCAEWEDPGLNSHEPSFVSAEDRAIARLKELIAEAEQKTS